jgi:hypothetical protein
MNNKISHKTLEMSWYMLVSRDLTMILQVRHDANQCRWLVHVLNTPNMFRTLFALHDHECLVSHREREPASVRV